MHLDTTLNLAWLLLGAFALGTTLRATHRSSRESKFGTKWLRVAGITLVVAALFPYISATDDILRMEHYTSQRDQHGSHKATPSDDLVRLYEALDAPVIAQSCGIARVLFVVSMFIVPQRIILCRIAPLTAGRSPPFLTFS